MKPISIVILHYTCSDILFRNAPLHVELPSSYSFSPFDNAVSVHKYV